MCLLVVRSESPSKLHHYITHSHVNDFSKETEDHLVRSSHFWTRLISFYQVFYYDGHVISCNILSTVPVLSMRYMYIHMSSLSIIACKLLQREKRKMNIAIIGWNCNAGNIAILWALQCNKMAGILQHNNIATRKYCNAEILQYNNIATQQTVQHYCNIYCNTLSEHMSLCCNKHCNWHCNTTSPQTVQQYITVTTTFHCNKSTAMAHLPSCRNTSSRFPLTDICECNNFHRARVKTTMSNISSLPHAISGS